MSVSSSVPPVDPVEPVTGHQPVNPIGMVAVDFDPDGLVITPCRCCREMWWAELVLVGRRVQLREWHRLGCPEWGDVVACATPNATELTAQDQVVRGDGLVGLHTAAADRGGSS